MDKLAQKVIPPAIEQWGCRGTAGTGSGERSLRTFTHWAHLTRCGRNRKASRREALWTELDFRPAVAFTHPGLPLSSGGWRRWTSGGLPLFIPLERLSSSCETHRVAKMLPEVTCDDEE
jgi:hypothetical protein